METSTLWLPFVAVWQFVLGSPTEGLNPPLSSMPSLCVPVSLPHSLLYHDTPYWYMAQITLTEPIALRLEADDGAQVFFQGVRYPLEGYVCPLNPTGSYPITGELVVRVLNKAMYGGLLGVEWKPLTQWRSETAPPPHDTELKLLVPPLLQQPNASSIKIVWETNLPCAAVLEWGVAGEEFASLVPEKNETLFTAHLTKLIPNSRYAYRVRYGSCVTIVSCFSILPVEGNCSFTVWADSQNVQKRLPKLCSTLNAKPSHFTVGVGDLVVDAYEKEQWVSFFQAMASTFSQTPVVLMGGNHDYDGCFETMRSPFLERYTCGNLYGAWSVGGARFVFLDPNLHFPTAIPEGSAQYGWFLRELVSEEWRSAQWRFVFIHQPPYSQGWKGYEGDIPIRELLEPRIETCGIDFVVSGHTHNYERWIRNYGKQRVHFLVVGGAGGGLEPEGELSDYPVMDRVIRRHHVGQFWVQEDRVDFEARTFEGEILDYFQVTK